MVTDWSRALFRFVCWTQAQLGKSLNRRHGKLVFAAEILYEELDPKRGARAARCMSPTGQGHVFRKVQTSSWPRRAESDVSCCPAAMAQIVR